LVIDSVFVPSNDGGYIKDKNDNFTQIKASPGNDKIRMKYRVTSAVFSIKIGFDSVFNQKKNQIADHNDEALEKTGTG